MYPKKLIEKLTHGKSVSHLIKTMVGKSKPPEVVTCFGSFKANMDDPGDYWEKQFFTYSRNGGPIQRITIDYSNVESDEDYIEIDALCSKVDKDLIRGQDGESLAFYINAGTHGLTTLDEQAIPVVNGNIYHMPDSPQLMSMSGPDQFEYAITGINGEGKIVLPSAYVVDARDIAVPHPFESIDTSNVIDYPRWYPKNSIQTEDNIITIYPSEGVSEYDFDLFKVMGGVGDTPITVHSCVVAVPPKVQCLPSFVYTADIDMPAMTRLNIEATPQSLNLLEGSPNTVNGLPFPFNMNGQSNSGYKPTNWPDSDGNTWGWDWVCTYSKNDGPIKTIGWNTGSNEGSHHSVWEAIKALMLDDEGRTAFTLTGFNALSPRWDRPSLKSGLSSGARFGDFNPDVDMHMWTNYEYREDAASVEIKDRQMQFTQTHAGLAWKENKLVIYPTTFEDAKQIGIYEYDDYYNFLCQFEEQVDEGNPITLHSCAVVEPIDHVRPNTGFKLDMSAIGEVMPPGLMARVQINDGEIKEFAEEGELMEKVLADLINYVSLLGADPIVTPYSGMNNGGELYARTQSKTNLLYFKSVAFNRESFIVGCSGIERPGDFNMELMNIDMEAQKMELLQVEILDDMDSDIPHVRGSNKVTFHRAVGSEYLDFFDFIADAKGDTHTIYSSAGVPCLLIGDSVDEGGDNGSMDDLEYEYMQWRAPWVFKLTKTNGQYESFNPTVFAQYGTDFVITDYDTGERLASSFGRTHEGIIQRIPENNNLDIIFDMDKLNTSRTFELYFGITGGSVTFGNDITTSGLKEGELEIIEWNSDCAPKVRISAANMTVKLPQTLPKEWTSLNSMFTYTNMANPDISMWDVSHVVDMEYMFNDATGFNQDLSNWCVQHMSSEPYNFRKNATKWTLPKPVWGTCPKQYPLPSDEDGIFKFTVTGASQRDTLSLTLTDPVGEWRLMRGDTLVRDSNSYGNVVNFTNEDNEVCDYTFIGAGTSITLGTIASNNDVTLVEITKLPTAVQGFSFPMRNANLVVPDVLPSNITSLKYAFNENYKFNQDLSNWDVSNVTDMTYTFAFAKAFNGSIGNWNTKSVTTMNSMFFGATAFNQPIGDWDVSNVTHMGGMFNQASAFNKPIGLWSVGKVTDMSSMFSEAKAFNQDISNWDISNVTQLLNMFYTASEFNQDIGDWDTSKVTLIGGMFLGASSFNQDLSRWCVTNIKEEPYDFKLSADAWTLPKPVWGTCPAKLPSGTPLEFNIYSPSTNNPVVPLTFTIKAPESGWGIYENNILVCSRWTDGPGIHTINGNNGFITIQVDRNNLMDKTVNYKLFAKTDRVRVSRGYSNLTGASPSIEVVSFSDSCASQAFGFEWANLTVPTVLPPCITNAYAMFEECRKFNQDLSTWDTSNILYMNNMFATCSNFNGNVSTWDVSNVTNMESMFVRATNFNQDLSGWNVVNIPTEPSNFAINATQWTLPKPIWGSDGKSPEVEGGSFSFSTINALGQTTELPLKVNLTGTGNPWSLIDVDTGDVVASEETLGSSSGVEVGLYLDSEGATSRNYRLDGRVSKLSIALEGDSNSDGLLEVTSFSDDISEYRYNLKDADILVPTTLPSHITSLDYMFAGCLKFDQDITGWDTSNVTSMEGTFKGCYSFNQDIGNWDVSNVTNMVSTFAECTMFNQDLSNWNTASLTNLSHTFAGCSNFNGSLNTWDVSKVTMLVSTFAGATSFDQPLSNWDVGMVYTMRECFSSASSFNQDISTWNVERVEDMQYAFNSALSFNQDLSNWNTASLLNLEGTFKNTRVFNSGIGSWNTSQVVTLSSTFQSAWAFNQPLNDWDVSNVGSMQSTFASAFAFNQPLNNWDVSNVGGSFPMYGMFEGATAFNQDLSSWCVPDVEYINKFDEGATSWSEPRPPWGYCGLQVVSSLQFTITTGNEALDKDRLTIGFPEGMPGTFKILKDGVLTNTSPDGYDSDIMNQYGQIAIYVPPNTTRTFTLQASAPVAQLRYYTDNTKSTNKIAIDAFSDNILRYEFSIQNADLTVPQTLPVHITSMFAMFKDSNRFNQDLSGWDVSRITNATDAFRDCVAFNGDVGTWRLDKLGIAQRMFMGCKVFNQPLNNWRFPELRVAIEMFSGCSAFNQDLNSWNVSSIRDFEGMFSGCTVFNGTITDWDMTGAAVLHKMFYNCRAFNQPIGNWNVASVSNFDGMFSYAISFNQDISTWDMSGVKNVNGLANMFAQATGFNQDLSTWNVLKVPSRPYEFDSGLTTTWTLPRPKWGTDGKPIIVPPIVPYDSNSFNVLIEQTETQSPTIVNITLNLNQDASDWEVWIGNELIASPQYAKAPVTVSNNTITIPNSNNRTQIAVKGSMSTVALLMASPVAYTSLGKITTSVINYSPTINSYRFTVKEAALTVPDTLPSHITSLSEMFKECTNILSDITGWDTSNIMYATSMLNGATNFNQDLSGWNMVNIKSKPTGFDDYCNSWTLPRPIWGSTGTPVVVPPPPIPEYTPFEFNVTSSGGAGFALETSGAPTEWMLYQDDVLITTEETMFNHRVSDLKEGVTNFKLFTDGASINVREGSAGTNTTIDFLSFCEAVPRTNFSIQSYNFTVPKTLPANHTDLRDMFKGCNAFNQDLSEWDTSRVTDMSQMFYETDVFNGNITTWNTSQVTNFTRMFSSARVFNQDISNWDVSNALYMGGMFDIALVFNQPIGNWDISKVTSTQDMFKNAWEFNQDLSSWNVSNVQSMDGMFFVAKTFNQDLSGWNVAHIPDEPINFANLAAAWSEPKPKWGEQPDPTWGPTVDCAGATENATLNISGGVSDLRYKVEINGHVFNEDGGVDISTGWHTVAPGLYFMCEDNGDNTLTMTVYEDDALNTLPVKLTPISHLTTATITGGDTVANPTFKYDEGTSSISFCVITEWAA